MTQTVKTGQAVLHYGDGDFTVLTPGAFVNCAVSGRAIAIETLRYWSAERQEAYLGPTEAVQAFGSARD